jgi:hypothetical protein
MEPMVRFSTRLLTLVLVLSLALAISASGATKTWSPNGNGTKNWSTDRNWSPQGVPGAGDAVAIDATAGATCNIDVNTASLGSFTMSGGSLIFASGISLNLNGNFSLTGGSFSSAGGTVNFLGANSTYANSIAAAFNNVTVNVGAGNSLTLSNNLVVGGTLTLTSGVVVTGSNEIDVNTGTAGALAITGGSVNGAVRRHFPANASGTYVFTDANTSIAPSSNQEGYILVQSFPNTFIPFGDQTKAIKRYYIITPAVALTGTLSMAYVDPGELNGLNENLFSAWSSDGSIWVDQGGFVNPSSDYVEVGPVSTWSYWTIAEAGGPLPIQLASSAANVIRNNDVEVAWKTVSETNNYGFEIYRKRGETGDWMNVGFVKGHATTLAPESYSFTDRSLSFGNYYYQIKQIDLDGKSETFPTMQVTVGVAPEKLVLAQNYPNPFNPSTMIEFVVPMSGRATMKVYNVLGQKVATLFDGNAEAGRINTTQFNASNLPSGVYFYTLRTAGQTETRLMLLAK